MPTTDPESSTTTDPEMLEGLANAAGALVVLLVVALLAVAAWART